MPLSDTQIGVIVKAEELAALDYEGELSKKRTKLMEYYNCEPYGDEVDGQSRAVTSDVSDVVEWMLPALLRIFTQGKLIARFEATREADEQEAHDKTALANHVFLNENNGVLVLHDMFKDALLQYTGTVKVVYEEEEESRSTNYQGLSEQEYRALVAHTDFDSVEDVEVYEVDGQRFYNAVGVAIHKVGGVKIYNIPPEEMMVSRTARDFVDPPFIGHRSPKRRSELIEMGFPRDVVDTLPADEWYELSLEKAARHKTFGFQDSNPANHHPNDTIYLGEYYMHLDVNGDGITELWKVFYAGDQVIEKEQVEQHPFAVCVPIPVPHRAIGSCPAEQAADIQLRKSTLVRHMYDNVYQSNYPRVMHSNLVDLDDLLTPRAGGTIEVDTDAGDVAGHAVPLVIPNMIEGIMAAIEYTDVEREVRTGATRYSQGIDGEALNKTATGFTGIMNASQQRQELIARLFAEGGVKHIFQKIVYELGRNQNEAKQIKILGKPMEIDPRTWGANTNCRIDVGLGAGDRQEKILNLNNILNIQERFMGMGLLLSDQVKMFNTLEKLIDETGLKDANEYFNNPELPEETLFAQNQQLTQMLQQMQQQMQNPLAEAELIKAKAKMAEVQGKESNSMKQFIMKMAQEDKQFAAELAKELTELELKYQQDVPGASV